MLARFGGVILLLGVAVGVGSWIAAGSLGDDGANGVAITAYFLLGALLFSALGWHRGALEQAPRPQARVTVHRPAEASGRGGRGRPPELA